MAGVSVEVFTDDPCPRVGITVDGLSTGGPSRITVWRSSPGGKRRAVRGLRNREVLGADYVVDFEAPLARDVTYELEVHSGAVIPATVSAQTFVPSTTGFVQDPLVPDTAVPVSHEVRGGVAVLASGAFRELTHAMGVEMVGILGSDEPVALGGQRLAAAGVDFSMLTRAAEQGTALRGVLRDAFPVLVRPLPAWGPLPDVVYLAPPSVVEQVLIAGGGELTRWQCTGPVVAPGSMYILVPIWTYADVEALWSTYAQQQAVAVAAGASYLDDLKDPTMGGA